MAEGPRKGGDPPNGQPPLRGGAEDVHRRPEHAGIGQRGGGGGGGGRYIDGWMEMCDIDR